MILNVTKHRALSLRLCYMMEIDNHYCDVIINRWQAYTGKKATHAETGIMFK